MNQLFSGVHPEALLADEIISSTRTTMATREASPVFTRLEVELVQSLGQRLLWNYTEGIGVPGGSSGNFMAIHCARHRYFPDTKTKGNGGREFRIFVSDQAHYSFLKGAIVLGLGSDAVVRVPTDREGRMDPIELKRLIQIEKDLGRFPIMVGATAGSTVLGAFDPLNDIADVCREEKLWFHIDGAWGGPVLFNQSHKYLLEGAERADSFSFDAHKLLGASLTSSLFLTSQKHILRQANDSSGGDYIFHRHDNIDLGRMSWQCGRRADSFVFWLLWKSRGDEGFDRGIEKLFQIRDEFITKLEAAGTFELIHTPSFLNVCFKIKGKVNADAENNEILRLRQRLINDNAVFINYSQDTRNGYFFRAIFANPILNSSQIDEFIAQLHR